MWKTCTTSFNLEQHLIVFLQDSPFYAEISRRIRKRPTKDMPTAAVAFDAKRDEIVMWYNPDFFSTLTAREVNGVITHEFNHLVFGHLGARHRDPNKLWNIATDLANNSVIVQSARQRSGSKTTDRVLPELALIPGVRPKVHTDPKLPPPTPEQIEAAEKLASLIESFPHDMSSEWYFFKLLEEAVKNGMDFSDKEFTVAIGPLDDHDGWGEIPDELREYIESRVKAIVEKAVHHADAQSNGWGSIPAHIQAEIRRSVSGVVNWRAVLKQFVGNLVRGERTTSIKRINRKYPYIHPGVKRGYTARLLIAMDQSGSVDDGQLTAFFTELAVLTRRVTVDILPFDCSADEKDIYEWRKGTSPKCERTRSGGTNFDAPTNIVNDAKNRGKWDGLLIMTDGECSAPGASRVKRGWVLSKGHKLLFDTNELQITVDETPIASGAWR